MQLDFFPSRTLTLYLAKLFVARIAAMLFVLVLVLMMLDLLSSSGEILAVPGNGQGELLTYAGLRIPQLISRFLPYSVLLATLITLVTLNQNSEVIAMKAAGLSAHQVLAPLLLTAGLVSLATFAFNERVVTRATETLKAWEAVDYGAIPDEERVRTNIYLNDDGNILTAAYLAGRGEAIAMRNVSWYRRNAEGMIIEQVDAERARYESGKILVSGMQDLGRTYADEAKSAAETVQGDVKKVAEIKSPTELFQLQGDIARRNFDAMVSATSKNTEAMLKLVNDAFAPVSNRMSLAAEKVGKAA